MSLKPSSIGLVGLLGAVALLNASCAQDQATKTKHSSAAPAAMVKPAAVQTAAKAPAPPANATKATTIGKGKDGIKTSNAAGDSDSYWVTEMDIDGDGDVEQTSLLWDDEDKVLFAYAETDTLCEWGGTASVSILVGVNGKGNPRNMPEGSGFYAVWLDASECAAEVAGLYGCKFNAQGNATACGVAVVDEATDTVMIIAEK